MSVSTANFSFLWAGGVKSVNVILFQPLRSTGTWVILITLKSYHVNLIVLPCHPPKKSGTNKALSFNYCCNPWWWGPYFFGEGLALAFVGVQTSCLGEFRRFVSRRSIAIKIISYGTIISCSGHFKMIPQDSSQFCKISSLRGTVLVVVNSKFLNSKTTDRMNIAGQLCQFNGRLPCSFVSHPC